MEVKHAPGPWSASFSFPGRDGFGDVWQIDADGHAVCTTQFCYAEGTEGNARLIAAAPELLEALEKLIMFTDPKPSNAAALNFAHQIVAKATQP